MANLSTENIGTNYKGILNLGSTINTPLSTTLQDITDGDGNASPLKISTQRIALGVATGTGLLNFPDAGTTAADGIQFGIGSSNLYRSGLNTIRTDGTLNVFGTLLLGNGVINASGGNITLNSVANLSAVTGLFSLYPPTLTGSSATSALSISQTWNTTGNPKAILLNLTNTASGATARPFEIQIGGSPILFVDKLGGITSTKFCLSALNTAPSSASDTGTLGEIRVDANYIYICTATNTWKRVAIATW